MSKLTEIIIDTSLLIEQKVAIMRAIARATDADVLLLHGVLNLLDFIHDTLDPPDLSVATRRRRRHSGAKQTKGDYSDE